MIALATDLSDPVWRGDRPVQKWRENTAISADKWNPTSLEQDNDQAKDDQVE